MPRVLNTPRRIHGSRVLAFKVLSHNPLGKRLTHSEIRDYIATRRILIEQWVPIITAHMKAHFAYEERITLANLAKGREGKAAAPTGGASTGQGSSTGQELSNLTNIPNPFPKGQMQSKLTADAHSWLQGMISDFSTTEAARLGVSFSQSDPGLKAAYAKQVNRIVGVEDTTHDAITGALLKVQQTGGGITDMQSAVKGVFADASNYRAEMIARTETAAACCSSALAVGAANGATGKSWLASGDECEEICAPNVEAGVIGVDDTFPSGDDAPPSHPNCRCDLLMSSEPLSGEDVNPEVPTEDEGEEEVEAPPAEPVPPQPAPVAPEAPPAAPEAAVPVEAAAAEEEAARGRAVLEEAAAAPPPEPVRPDRLENVFGKYPKKQVSRTTEDAISRAEELQGKELTVDERAALDRYTDGAYKAMNHALRHGTELDEESAQDVQLLDQAFAEHSSQLSQPRTLYRGVGWGSTSGSREIPEVGQILQDGSYLSTSMAKGAATDYLEAKPNVASYLVVIDAPAGTPYLIGSPVEGELILPRSTSMVVDRVETPKLGSSTVYAHIVPEQDLTKPTEAAVERYTTDIPPELAKSGRDLVTNMTTEESTAVEDYTTGSYRDLNVNLMEGRTLTDSQKANVKNLDSVIKKAGALPPDTIVYRGLKIGPTKGVLESDQEFTDHLATWAREKFTPGSIISGHGYQSTSTAIEPALDAALSTRSPGIIMEIEAKSGAYLGEGASHFDDESEVLMGRDTKFEVIGVDTNAKFLYGDDEEERTRTVIRVRQL